MENRVNRNEGTDFDMPKTLAAPRPDAPPTNLERDDEASGWSSKLTSGLGSVTDVFNQGYDAVKCQIRTVQEKGIGGVTDDVTTYAKKEPFKALLLAGGIGALTALILRSRR